MSWPLVKLGAVCKLVNGDRGTNYPSKDSILSHGIPFINAGNLTEDHSIVCSGANYISEERYDLLSNGKIQFGDILFCLRGSLGKFAVVDSSVPKGAIASSLVIIRPDKSICEDYLKNYLRSTLCAREISRFENGAAQPNLSAKDLREFEIPLPPLPEQKRIAAILDKADAIRRKRQQAIKLADDFLWAVFLDMFGDPATNPKGWPVDKFGNVFDVRDGTHDSPSYVESGFPLITSKNIKNGEIDMSDVNYISKEDYELINRRSKVDVGDILMPMIGTIGNPAVVHDEPLFAIKNVALIKLGKSSLPAGFVLALLNGPLLEVAVQQKSRGGTQKFLSLGDIRDLNCYLPDERLVCKYIGIANKVRQYASAYRKADEAGLDSSLSQKAFSGQL